MMAMTLAHPQPVRVCHELVPVFTRQDQDKLPLSNDSYEEGMSGQLLLIAVDTQSISERTVLYSQEALSTSKTEQPRSCSISMLGQSCQDLDWGSGLVWPCH